MRLTYKCTVIVNKIADAQILQANDPNSWCIDIVFGFQIGAKRSIDSGFNQLT